MTSTPAVRAVAGIREELNGHITSLENALSNIAATKRHLANNAAQAKSRIHSMMSRQLEALRTREVWLLGQVELLHDTKDHLLRQQADSLRQALGALSSCRQYLESGEPADIEQTIQDTIHRLSKLELSPLETRHLSFQADLVSMRDAIHSFGRVETRGGGDALDLGWTGDSRSLPRAFEEYEDDDDTMYCKTVQDITTSPGGCTHRKVNVSVPKLKAQPSDWLFLPPDVQPPQPTLPRFTSDLNKWLLREHTEAKAPSVQHWLQEIQTHTEEDEDSTAELLVESMQHVVRPPRTSHVSTSSIDVLSLPGSTISTTVQTEAVSTPCYFRQVADAPTEQWLRRDAQSASKQPHYVAMTYFAELARHSKQQWLLNQQESGCCKGSPVSSCPPVSPDIEDLQRMTCLTSQPLAEEEEEEKDVDEREVAVRNNIDQLCRANEVCHTFTDCVCDDNCGNDGSKSTMKAWLARPSSMQDLKGTTPVFEHFSMVSGAKSAEWLAQSKSPEAEQMDIGLYPPFHSSSSNSAWLLTSQRSNEASPFTHMRSSQASEWITPRRSSQTSSWLASTPRPETKINPWLATPPSSCQAPAITTDKLKEYLDQAQPKYQWSLTKDDTAAKISHDDKPIPKKQELPECDNKDSNRYAESAKWLLVMKDEEEEFQTKEVMMDQSEKLDLFPLFAKNKAALGEWLMNVHSDF